MLLARLLYHPKEAAKVDCTVKVAVHAVASLKINHCESVILGCVE